MVELGYAKYKDEFRNPDNSLEVWVDEIEMVRTISTDNLSFVSETKTLEAEYLQKTQPPFTAMTGSSTKNKPSLMHWSTILETLSMKDMVIGSYNVFYNCL